MLNHIRLSLPTVLPRNQKFVKLRILTLVRTLKVLTPSSTALSISSIRLSVDPRRTIVEMAPSSFSANK